MKNIFKKFQEMTIEVLAIFLVFIASIFADTKDYNPTNIKKKLKVLKKIPGNPIFVLCR